MRTLQEPFTDTFDRLELGEDWLAMSPAWRIVQGRLCTGGARNRPVWLKKHMPANARIVFDATPASPDGEIKAEFWGDGESVALGLPYDYATSYVTIFGGWKNQLHVLARLDEHGLDRQELTIDPTSPDPRLMRAAPGNTYRFKVERTDGETVRWYIDDLEMLSYADEWSLSGPRHDHFAFNDSGTRVCFDNLTVTPL